MAVPRGAFAVVQAASAAMRFEEASEIRDAIRWLDQLEQPASVEVVGGGDADAIGLSAMANASVYSHMPQPEGFVQPPAPTRMECLANGWIRTDGTAFPVGP